MDKNKTAERFTDFNGKTWTADGKKLSDKTIANIINVLIHPELRSLFTSSEIALAQIAVRNNISTKLDSIKEEVEEKSKVKIKTK